MAFRKTEAVLAAQQARKQAMIDAAIEVIARGGIDALTTQAVADRVEVSIGTVYNFFADGSDLLAAAIVQLARADINAMRNAAKLELRPINALAAALTVFYSRQERRRLVEAMSTMSSYRDAIIDEIARLLEEVVPQGRQIAAAGVLGALYGIHGFRSGAQDRASAAVAFALLGIGVPAKAVERLVD
jgi:AcrR family transcriptional regulator